MRTYQTDDGKITSFLISSKCSYVPNPPGHIYYLFLHTNNKRNEISIKQKEKKRQRPKGITPGISKII